MKMSKHPLIKKIYLYLFSLLGLTLITIGSMRLLTLGLKVYVFTKADVYYEYPQAPQIAKEMVGEGTTSTSLTPSREQIDEFNKNQRTSNRQRDAAESLAMIIVGLPLYLYHWSVIKKEKDNKDNDD